MQHLFGFILNVITVVYWARRLGDQLNMHEYNYHEASGARSNGTGPLRLCFPAALVTKTRRRENKWPWQPSIFTGSAIHTSSTGWTLLVMNLSASVEGVFEGEGHDVRARAGKENRIPKIDTLLLEWLLWHFPNWTSLLINRQCQEKSASFNWADYCVIVWQSLSTWGVNAVGCGWILNYQWNGLKSYCL